ncbi:phosphohydrolase [Photobacterium kishitanii]|uniref:Phosphohydrolase n=1 Tax=Photobacterium kishitanii TaxID=318456 RepID=A0AAX0YST0_9GAMM|nr:HD domain-containing protein [Photobacterium kishitanii]PSX18262.1 phosphohydrolase [Photobacterium kishitanii]PSX26763.1 phosphohydrolase [Photobacterium kishitanii]PSX30795.1 phosphohydrolase [Photobacterium kishitanii]PSX44013.1 phosphohydrolase [Photobacterium kishitanii]
MLQIFENQFIDFIESEMTQDQAHDLNHIFRVVKTAKALCKSEGAKLEVVLPAAYLHDCFSFPKNHPDRAQSSQIASKKALDFLGKVGYNVEYFKEIGHAITTHSFSANLKPETLEAQIVQDADRLDALGAIGIARCIQVSAELGVNLYDREDPFSRNRELNDKLHTIDHFYTKLFKLKDTMNTASAKSEAEIRTAFMKEYLKQLGTEI